MTAPEIGGTYVDPCTGRSYRVVDVTALHAVVVRVDVHEPGVSYVAARERFGDHFVPADDLTELAEAVGVLVDALRRPGDPLAVEFSTGPSSYGPFWSDARLGQLVEVWAREVAAADGADGGDPS
ncbi:hypothetical protein [Nocardioides soli]|uniref:Uncharacterized protein n=1 Tax=Nocardioides soli TaxID=1036020 RepID=A0A7W4YZQ0_9ACTN|nr:hypothetical protein [Nocardioides soli]MBB3041177.1 hypothetical protein [Nocardioides soli]